MDNLSISIFSNKIFFEIIKEIKLFSKFKIKHYDDFDLCVKDAVKENQIVVFFNNSFDKSKIRNFPSIAITPSSKAKNNSNEILHEHIKMPFKIIDFKRKIVSLAAKSKFKENSLINLGSYIIDKNERKIKKNDLELQLSEKEINFLILFSKTKKPISKNFVLENVWKYSVESETHTVETHIHRLRKKISKKFGDSNFIKNNDKGYFI
tara:strand:- start:631 stop:1254 length:624 start_codon:yes stop_codon:yes gene_type:complete